MKKTLLYDKHVSLGAKMIDLAADDASSVFRHYTGTSGGAF